MAGILAVVIILLIYGSLYPWAFVARDLPASPLYILFHSWNADFHQRRILFDIAVNIAIYMPLGMSAYLTFRRFQSRVLRILTPVAIGALLSGTLEMIQLYTPSRQCSAVDLLTNIVGSGLGVAAGSMFQRILPEMHPRDRGALGLLFCWIAYLIFPLFPVLHRDELAGRTAAFLQSPVFSPVTLLTGFAAWFAAGQLLRIAGARRPLIWLCLLLCLEPLQVAIVTRTPTFAGFAAGLIAVLVFAAAGKMPRAIRISAILLLLAITIGGLSPFTFSASPQRFIWIPFGGLLNAPWQIAITILLRKLFLYAAAVWLLNRSGLSFAKAAATVTILLAAIEVLQTRLPPHVAEITDPLLAVLSSLALWMASGTDGKARPARTLK